MTTITPPTCLAAPEGADEPHSDGWQPAFNGKPAYRFVWSKPFDSDNGLDIRVVAVQFEDGTIADGQGDPDDAPLVYIANTEHQAGDARALAASILRAADQADKWAGTNTELRHDQRDAESIDAAAALDVALAALESVCKALRLAPGNAGCWAKSALDAAIEARMVLR